MTAFRVPQGTAVTDATIATTDVTTNNAATTKHGWLAKLNNSRSYYMGGKGEWNRFSGTSEWFVDVTVTSGGDGRSPAGAFNTFAAANTAAQPHDKIHILSNLAEALVIDTPYLHVVGVGWPIISGSGTSINDKIIHVTHADFVTIQNLQIRGHAGWKGTGILFNFSSGSALKRIRIDGTVNSATATFYPTTAAAGTGIGGIGIMGHRCDVMNLEDVYMVNCSIGLGLGTWSTRCNGQYLYSSQNAQDLVTGLHSGVWNADAVSQPFAYGGTEQTGFAHFTDWTIVNNVGLGSFGTPTVHIIGNGVFDTNVGQGSHFEKMVWTESGGQPWIHVGEAGCTFTACDISAPAIWYIYARRTHFYNCSNGSALIVASSFNKIDGMPFPTGQTPVVHITGSYNTVSNVDFYNSSNGVITNSGTGNKYNNCRWLKIGTGGDVSRTQVGTSPTIIFSEGPYSLTQAATVTPDVATGSFATIPITTNAAIMIANPIDSSNNSNTSKIMCTNPLTLDIFNTTGVAMGSISLGGKYRYNTITAPGAGKHLILEFMHYTTDDTWVETNRLLHV